MLMWESLQSTDSEMIFFSLLLIINNIGKIHCVYWKCEVILMRFGREWVDKASYSAHHPLNQSQASKVTVGADADPSSVDIDRWVL